jgi:hypothetical protein
MHFDECLEKRFLGMGEMDISDLASDFGFKKKLKKRERPLFEKEGQPLSLHRMRINRESPSKGASSLFLSDHVIFS